MSHNRSQSAFIGSKTGAAEDGTGTSPTSAGGSTKPKITPPPPKPRPPPPSRGGAAPPPPAGAAPAPVARPHVPPRPAGRSVSSALPPSRIAPRLPPTPMVVGSTNAATDSAAPAAHKPHRSHGHHGGHRKPHPQHPLPAAPTNGAEDSPEGGSPPSTVVEEGEGTTSPIAAANDSSSSAAAAAAAADGSGESSETAASAEEPAPEPVVVATPPARPPPPKPYTSMSGAHPPPPRRNGPTHGKAPSSGGQTLAGLLAANAAANAAAAGAVSSGLGSGVFSSRAGPPGKKRPSLSKTPGASSSPSHSSTLKKGDLASPVDTAPSTGTTIGSSGNAVPPPRGPPPVPTKPVLPPRPSTPPPEDLKKAREELDTLKYYLKMAIDKKDWDALKDLVKKGNALHVSDDLLTSANKLLDEKVAGEAKAELNTVQFYLKQGIESKNKDALKLALGKVEPLQKAGQVFPAEFTALIEKGRKLLAGLEKEATDTLKFYIKQGMQMKNREILKETMDKVAAQQAIISKQITSAGGSPAAAQAAAEDVLGDKELLVSAAEMLKSLDAQHLIKFFLSEATKAKDIEAIEGAITKARALAMAPDIKELAEATKMLNELKAKAKRKTAPKGGFTSLFGGKSDGKSGGDAKWQLFGGKLSEAVKKSPAGPNSDIPKICHVCMEFLEAKALLEPGLFRVPGNNDNIGYLERQFSDDAPDIKLDDIHDVAGLFKLYLRKLPAPLIPFDSYSAFIAAGQAFGPKDQRRWMKFKELVYGGSGAAAAGGGSGGGGSAVPQDERALLIRLCSFLKAVSSHQEMNKMTSDNIAIVFAPNLLRPAVETAQTMLQDMPIGISVIATFIDHCDEIFGGKK